MCVYTGNVSGLVYNSSINKEKEIQMTSVFAIAEQYEGIYTTEGVFTTRELAEQALENYLAQFTDLEFRKTMAEVMYIEELTLHA
jgi:hypothetical protein